MAFLDDLREAEAETKANARITIAVPRSRFAVRFRAPVGGRAAITPYLASYGRNGALSAEEEVQLIVDCCDEILRRSADGELEGYGEPLTFDAGDDRWDDDGDTPKTARECVERLYRLDEQPAAAAGTSEGLIGWLQGFVDGAPVRVEGKSEKPAT